MARIDREEVERIARLARLRLDAEQASALAGDLDAMLGYVELLGEVDTSSVGPTAHVLSLTTPFREDRVLESLDPEIAVANAPAREGSAFCVPKVLEGEEEA